MKRASSWSFLTTSGQQDLLCAFVVFADVASANRAVDSHRAGGRVAIGGRFVVIERPSGSEAPGGGRAGAGARHDDRFLPWRLRRAGFCVFRWAVRGRLLFFSTTDDHTYDAVIVDAGAIEPLVELERNGSDDAKKHATDALDSLECTSDFEAAVAAARRRVAPAVDPTIAAMANLAACIVCQDAARSVVFLPCAHACFCTSCAASHQATSAQCPICRTAITGSVAFRLA